MKIIALTRGYEAKIDDEDFDRIDKHSWCVTKSNARHVYGQATIKQKRILLHRFIMNAPTGTLIDHISGDTLDNQKNNLRFSTKSQNALNWHTPRSNKSGVRGVSWANGVWVSEIKISGKRHRGCFKSFEDAVVHRKTLEKIK